MAYVVRVEELGCKERMMSDPKITKKKSSESGKLIQKEESRSDSESSTKETKSRPPDRSGSSLSYKGKDCMGNENFTIFDSKFRDFNRHLGEEEMQSLPRSHPTWAEVLANNNQGQCLDTDPVQPQDQYQAREVGVGQLSGSHSAMPVISSAQDHGQVANARTCQQSGLSDPNQAPNRYTKTWRWIPHWLFQVKAFLGMNR
ncbi:hypothetical protein V6N12_041758 [Hibiscus sabdariffa]|uniref:Uncharacterized protein n=2 Tax=Hibiscus sabdariffa TaxID=183260 RepID=A0ABR1ZEZ1_9ROSI